MKKESDQEINYHHKSSNNMSSSAVAYHATEAGSNPNDAGYGNSGSYYHPNEGHHPPMLASSYSYSSHQSNQLPSMIHQQPHYPSDGYSTAQYSMPYHQTQTTTHTAGYQYAQPPTSAPMPPPRQQQSRYHHPPQSAQPPMYYGSWPGASMPAPLMNQQQYQHQVHYVHPSYSEQILPPENATRHGNLIRPSSSGRDINVFGMPSEELETALFHVKRNPKATLFDVEGMIADIACYDEGGSRFIHKRLRLGTIEEHELGMKAAIAAIEDLWPDNFGNFMLQGLFEFGTPEMKKELMEHIYAQDVVALCMHVNGCRVIQKAIRCLEEEEVCKLVTKFHDQVLTFTHDPNGNHVIQRSIQVLSAFAKIAMSNGDDDIASSLSDQMQFIIDDIVANTETLSTHRYGCRVVQRVIEHCLDEQKDVVLEHIIDCHDKLVVDQYGNYVIQQVLVYGNEEHLAAILTTLTENDALLAYSKHKYASNVVEAILENGEPNHKGKILKEMLKDTRGEEDGYCCVIELAKDSIANYVVNKAIEVTEKDMFEEFVEIISSNRDELSKTQYGKYVLQKMDKRNKVQVTKGELA